MNIIVKGKSYDSGKIVRSKYSLFQNAFKKLEGKELYDDEDLDLMVSTLVNVYDNQFTSDDINDDLEVADIIMGFMAINISVAEKMNKKTEKLRKLFPQGK